MDDLIYRRISEIGYLDTENTWRYRSIVHYCFLQHEKMRHFLYPEEIFQYLKQKKEFHDYTLEQLGIDLRVLEEKKNLISRQDTGRVTSIQDFKQKRFRYQISQVSVEIERMIRKLEVLSKASGGSLEITLFDSLYHKLGSIPSVLDLEADNLSDQVNALWEGLYGDFRKIVENASDYLGHCTNSKMETHLKKEAFLLYKDAFSQYLRNFIIGLQKIAPKIQERIKGLPESTIAALIRQLAHYQMSIPRLEEAPLGETYWTQFYEERWLGLSEWFCGKNDIPSEWKVLLNETTEVIRRISRHVQRLGERLQSSYGRRRDYEHLGKWFSRLSSLEEAHRLSSIVFGVMEVRHLKVITELDGYPDLSLWERPTDNLDLRSRGRVGRKNYRNSPALSRHEEKTRQLQEYWLKRRQDQERLMELLQKEEIDLNRLGHVDSYLRKVLLGWISRSILNQRRPIQVETGHCVELKVGDLPSITLKCDDGELHMPHFVFRLVSAPPRLGDYAQ